jgi:hypothetical protein
MTLRRWSVARLLLATVLCVPFAACQKDTSTPQTPQKDTLSKDKSNPPPAPIKNGEPSKSAASPEKSKPE